MDVENREKKKQLLKCQYIFIMVLMEADDFR